MSPSKSQRKKQNRKKIEATPWQLEALTSKATHFAMLSGIACGKTWTGAHFTIKQLIEYPDLTGGIFANTYDQLSQATLRELFYWLDEYGIPYVCDRRPPKDWGITLTKSFKSYNNILSVKIGNKIAYAFTRVLSHPDALRGIEFSWYWMDETRDTPQNAHDIILSRLRESKYVKGLITTTTAGEDWCYERFVKKRDGIIYDCAHTPTSRSVEFGLITPEFYNVLRASYSPNMAAQELDAKHVSALEGRAYYTACEENRRRGYFAPDPDIPLIVGMDFNFSPAPMCWAIGQLSEDGESIHWFDELAETEIASRDMARKLANKYGDFFLRIFGDASGNRGTTSNAGMTDFNQIAEELANNGVQFSIDVDQANPFVRDRVENVCRLLKDSNGETHMTFNPDTCPRLALDLDRVTWKNGKLCDNGDNQLTHMSDGAGYALFKLLPPLAGRARVGKNIASQASAMGRD